jgi:GNAT superfamily N-acetyltransferase
MASILHLRKQLSRRPVTRSVAEVGVRSMVVPDDIDAWLSLHGRATAGLRPPVRRWSRDDFLAEMVQKPWWRSDWTWITSAPGLGESRLGALIGAVTLGLRHGRESCVPVIHWLLVDPAWRRRGVGRRLVRHLERAAWEAGWREVQLETHAGWTEAIAFYHSIGYALVGERSPR